MFVYLGKYKNYIGPYQIANALCFWVPKVENEFKRKELPEWVDKFGDFLDKTWLNPICNWAEKYRKRLVIIHIHKYDTWGMDSTLSPIILPMLKQLNGEKQGAPNVDDCDVPESLKSTSAPEKENDYDIDDFHFERWNYVLSEMIWAFEQLTSDWESQFHSGVIDWKFENDEETGNSLLIKGPNHTAQYDSEGYMKYSNRISNGTMLFGKYFRSLWS